jgi:D-threo-aldose 1-dehydrogenase
VIGSLPARRWVGRSALELPPLGLGTAPLGELYAKVEESVAQATLGAAWDAGIRFFDTAPWYGRGLSEHRVGGFLRTRRRDEFAITTKVGRTLRRPKEPRTFDRSPWMGGLNFEIEFDYSRDGIMRSYEQALQRLALDTLDGLVIHDLEAIYHGDNLAAHRKDLVATGIKALEELKAAGDIKAYGIGVNSGDALDQATSLIDLDFILVAMPYTLLDQGTLRTGMADCLRRGISVIIGAPFASGILASGSGKGAKYAYANAGSQVQAKVSRIEDVCAAHGVGLAAAALQFPLAHPAVVSIIPGAAHPSEVVQNVASLRIPIPVGFWSDLKGAGLIDPDAPVPSLAPASG